MRLTSGGAVSGKKSENSPKGQTEGSPEYVAPEIEAVITAESLDREVQYAGDVSQKAG